jgi:flagellar basal body rod protein FlgG
MNVEKVVHQGLTGQLQILRQSSEQLTQTQQNGQVRQTSFQSWLNGEVQSQQLVGSADLAGTVRHTGQTYDIALPAGTMMVVEHQGQLRLSRDGHLQPDEQGTLRQQSGAVALSAGGEPLQTQDFNGNQLQVWLVRPTTSAVQLPALGAGLYQADFASWQNVEQGEVIRASLNQPDAELSQTMIELLQVQRSVESLQKAYQTYDATLSYGISELGRR